MSEFNRSTLLRLRGYEAPDDLVPVERVDLLRAMLERYLQDQLPDKPDAHRFIIASCLGLAFVLREPMHPIEPTGIRFRVQGGAATYYCPLRKGGDGSLCELCVCRPMGEWEQQARQAISSCSAEHGDVAARISRAAFDAGLLECGELPTSALEFRDSVRRVCEGNSCGAYNTTWACPPAVGDLDACRERCMGYERLQLVSCAYPLDDDFDFENIPRFMADFDRRIDALAESVRSIVPESLVLSNEGCTRCKRCTWPDAPCRFPDRMHPAIEGFGLAVGELATQAGMRYNNGVRTVTFFGGVLY